MAKRKPTPIPPNATAYGHPMHPAAASGPQKGVLRPLTAPPPGTFPSSSGGSSGGATPPPYDPSVDEAAIIGGRNVAITNGNAAYDTGNLSFDYGYNPDGTVNTANPYSRAALYQLAYTNSKRGTLNRMGSQGELYSGAYGTAQGLNDTAYARNEAGNRLGYQRAIHGIQAGQLAAYANAGSGVSGADFSALLKSVYPSGG
jgi:hypothetical protein